MKPEDDVDHKIRMMLEKRKEKKPAEAEEKKEAKGQSDQKDAKPEAKTGEKSETKPSGNLTGLIAEVMKFRTGKPQTEPEKKAEEEKKEEKKEEVKPEAKKTIVSKKKAEPTQPDPMRVAAEAAGAAVKEAVGALAQRAEASKPKAATPEDELPEEYRHDYEVAKHLAATNAKYKDAPQAVLNEFARTEEYARSWEAQNRGKTYDPTDGDHDDFYAGLSKPWNEHEFREAEIEMAAERIVQRKSVESETRFKEMEAQNARLELTPMIQQAVNASAGLLARTVDEAAHEIIAKQGYDKLLESEPIIAEELARAIEVLQPMIRTAIEVDDPKSRIPFDAKKNPEQAQWLRFLFEKEEEFAGQKDDKGRLFASRNEFVKLSQAQQAKRWYLTVEHLVSEMVADTAAVAKENIERERERVKKTAERMGYVPKEQQNGQAESKTSKSEATKTEEAKKAETSKQDGSKPISPAAGAGVKIDNKSEPTKTGRARLIEIMAENLFRR